MISVKDLKDKMLVEICLIRHKSILIDLIKKENIPMLRAYEMASTQLLEELSEAIPKSSNPNVS